MALIMLILAAIGPMKLLIDWLVSLQQKGGTLTAAQRAKMNHLLTYVSDLRTRAMALGCNPNGVEDTTAEAAMSPSQAGAQIRDVLLTQPSLKALWDNLGWLKRYVAETALSHFAGKVASHEITPEQATATALTELQNQPPWLLAWNDLPPATRADLEARILVILRQLV